MLNNQNIKDIFLKQIICDKSIDAFDYYMRREKSFHNYDNHKYPQIDEHAEVIAMGCSISAGFALPINYSWPQIVKNTTGVGLNSCASTGSGYMLQLHLLMCLINKTSIPKKIYALMPDSNRLWPPNSAETLMWIHDLGAYVEPAEAFQHFSGLSINTAKKQEPTRKRYKAFTFSDFNNRKYLFPIELGIQQSFLALNILVMFSKINNIELSVYSWDSEANENIKNMYPNVHIGDYKPAIDKWYSKSPTDSSMCTNHFPMSLGQKKYWDMADDGKHPGLHEHIHFAEAFLNKKFTESEIRSIG